MGFKAGVRIVVNRVLNPLGFEFSRFRFEGDSFPVTPSLIERQIRMVTEQAQQMGGLFSADGEAIADAVRNFYELFEKTPVRPSSGGCGFNAGLILFVAARLAKPRVIIESGTFKGFTAWVFRSACPEAEIHCFDITFAELTCKDPTIHYHEHDWMERDLGLARPEDALCFFDDHVSQARRVIEAHDRGFERLIFDDNLPVHALHRDGTPAVPTVDMMFDEQLADGETIEWVSFHRKWAYRHDASLATEVRRRIKRMVRAPALYDETGYAPANLTFVELG